MVTVQDETFFVLQSRTRSIGDASDVRTGRKICLQASFSAVLNSYIL